MHNVVSKPDIAQAVIQRVMLDNNYRILVMCTKRADAIKCKESICTLARKAQLSCKVHDARGYIQFMNGSRVSIDYTLQDKDAYVKHSGCVYQSAIFDEAINIVDCSQVPLGNQDASLNKQYLTSRVRG